MFVLIPEVEQWTVIRDGFASGYGGTGPAGLTQAILLVDSWGWEISEIRLDEQLFEKLASGRTTSRSLDQILDKSRRFPASEVFYRYVSRDDLERAEVRNVWDDLPIVLPIPLLDRRLMDLVVSFWDDPDAALTRGYRRLEDIIRTRIGSDDHGAKLFSRAFGIDSSPLVWDSSESRAYAQLFIGAFSAFRNARAHRELDDSARELVAELLQLNMLFALEARLIERPTVEPESSGNR